MHQVFAKKLLKEGFWKAMFTNLFKWRKEWEAVLHSRIVFFGKDPFHKRAFETFANQVQIRPFKIILFS
jgi:hypothetical protein